MQLILSDVVIETSINATIMTVYIVFGGKRIFLSSVAHPGYCLKLIHSVLIII